MQTGDQNKTNQMREKNNMSQFSEFISILF